MHDVVKENNMLRTYLVSLYAQSQVQHRHQRLEILSVSPYPYVVVVVVVVSVLLCGVEIHRRRIKHIRIEVRWFNS